MIIVPTFLRGSQHYFQAYKIYGVFNLGVEFTISNRRVDVLAGQIKADSLLAVESIGSTLKSFVGHARMGYTIDQAGLKRSLGLNTKSILQQWKQQPGKVTSVPGFAKNYDEVTKLSGVLKGAGYVGIALDVGQSGLKIHEACTIGADLSCGKATAGESARVIGSGGGVHSEELVQPMPLAACSSAFHQEVAILCGTLLWQG